MSAKQQAAKPAFWYVFCDHWTQGGIGYSFPAGWHAGQRYERTFSTVYTIDKMLDATEQWPGLVSTLEIDAFAYEELQREGQGTLERLKHALREGRAGIEGGTYGQPLGQDFGAESNLRQLTYGRATILDILDYPVHTFLVEEQWFHPQLPQLLRTSGYRYACLQAQNSGQADPMKRDLIDWRGADGTTIPTIPANDLQVSCVRQYTDYAAYAPVTAKYDDPLLFQWIEVWVPGMDWGASATPFAKAIEHMFAAGGRPTTLQGYFEAVLPGRALDVVDIPLDRSNYANNWYQAGGWGYDGDRVIQLDAIAEHAALNLETLAALVTPHADLGPGRPLDAFWKRLMVLQNHDFSVARNYGVWTEDGQLTENGYLAQAGYRRLTAELDAQSALLVGASERLGIFNHTDAAGSRIYAAPGKKPVQIDLPAVGWAPLPVLESDTDSSSDGTRIGDERFDISWNPGSWDVEIRDRQTGIDVTFAGVSGRIAKVNEHDGLMWPALSPGHEVFSFAFDGTVHAPDQVAAGRVTARVERQSDLRSTLVLGCDLLTLHTTPTPVNRAEVRVHLDHVLGQVELEVFLYAGVWMGLESCRAIFRHNLADTRYFRDYPFGEEEAHVEAVYPLSYTRLEGRAGAGETGLQIVHAGSRRAFYHPARDGGRVEYLLARSKIRGEYRFGFTLVFGATDTAATATRRARFLTAPLKPIGTAGLAAALLAGRSFVSFDRPEVVLTSVSSSAQLRQGMSEAMVADQGGSDAQFLGERPHLVVRGVNMSDGVITAQLKCAARIGRVRHIEATGRVIGDVDPAAGLRFEPYAVKTFALELV